MQGTAAQALLAATVPTHGGMSILSTLPMKQAIVLVGKDDRLDKSLNLLTRNYGFGTSIVEEKLQPRHNEVYIILAEQRHRAKSSTRRRGGMKDGALLRIHNRSFTVP